MGVWVVVTDSDMEFQVQQVVDACWGTYDVKGIVSDLIERHGQVNIDTIADVEFWEVVQAHAIERTDDEVPVPAPLPTTYTAWRADGRQLLPGEPMEERRGDHPLESDEPQHLFHAVAHPRKITVRIPCDDWWARDGYTVREYYPTGYGVEIRTSHGYVWNPVSEVGRTMPVNLEV